MKYLAYDENSVRNVHIQDIAEGFLETERLTPPQYEAVKTEFPINFKQSNIFVRLGLFLFTSLCISFAITLIIWITGSFAEEKSVSALLLFSAITLFVINRFFINDRRWYRQGSDNALSYASIICFVGSISLAFNLNDGSSIFFLSFFIISLATWYYGDPILAFGAFYTLFVGIFLIFSDTNLAKPVLPFINATLSIAIYFFAKKGIDTEGVLYWKDCFKVLEIMGLVGFYLSLNYLFVSSLYSMADASIPSPYSQLFAIFTAIIPLFYLFFGIRNKDRILWILGGLGIVASILTYRYYHAIMPLEWALTLAGLAVLVFALFLLQYLKTPKNGFSYQPQGSKGTVLEGLIVNQLIQQQTPTPNSDVKFGGGDFGGGGASDNY